MSAAHTPGPWSQGTTLATAQTRRWNNEKWEQNQAQERRMVFAGFTASDHGQGRRLVATCPKNEADASLIAAAPELLEVARLLALATDEGDDAAQGTHYVDRAGVIRCKGSFLATIASARAAIAKATGGAL